MPEFIFINCPNCKTKIKIDREKKYHDCEECKYEFRSDQITLPEKTAAPGADSLLAKLANLRAKEDGSAG